MTLGLPNSIFSAMQRLEHAHPKIIGIATLNLFTFMDKEDKDIPPAIM